jgi:erythromycin esterase
MNRFQSTNPFLPVPEMILMITLVLMSACTSGSESSQQAFVTWAAENAIVLNSIQPDAPDVDLKPLDSLFQNATLAGLGESRHDTREQVLFRHRLVRHLVTTLGYRAFVLEESLTHAETLDTCIRNPVCDLRDKLNRLAGWYLWDTAEMAGMFEWLQDFNRGRPASDQVRVFGVDITAPADASRQVLRTIEQAGLNLPTTEAMLRLDLQQGDFWPATWQRYSALTDAEKDALTTAYSSIEEMLQAERQQLAAHLSPAEYEKTLLLSRIGSRGNALFSSASREAGGAIREAAMAENLFWALAQMTPGTQAIFWSHNLHVAKASFRMPGLAEGPLMPMGRLLAEKLGDRYIAIGATFGGGSYPATLPPGERVFEPAGERLVDGALRAVGESWFMLDLRQVETGSAAADWLAGEHGWRAQDADSTLIPAESFDAVYFVERISRGQPSARSLEQFNQMR